MYAPIALFVYARLEHTKAVIEALLRNPEAAGSDLFIFSDAPKNGLISEKVNEVRQYLFDINGFKSIKIECQSQNKGLSNSIRYGVSKVLRYRRSVIVLEDDILVSENFLKYMNAALKKYECIENVVSISGFVYPNIEGLPENFFIRGADCWGWGTWQSSWNRVNFDAKSLLLLLQQKKLERVFDYEGNVGYTSLLHDQVNGLVDSWAICWHAHAFLNNLLTLYPSKSLVQNIGNDGSGIHSETSSKFWHASLAGNVSVMSIPVEESIIGREKFKSYFYKNKKNIFFKIINRIKNLI